MCKKAILCYNSIVKQWLKDHFIPHEGNDHQPHFLRLKITAGLLALILLFEALYLANTLIILPKSDYFAAIFASVLIEQTNKKRLDGELGQLAENALLKEAARLKAEDMAAKGYFAHNSPDGKEPWYWFEKAGYIYRAAGENLAVNFTDSKDVTDAWMRSPTHRENILNNKYTEIGIATAQGAYKGREAIFVVQMFGSPLPVFESPSAPQSQPEAPLSPAVPPRTKTLPTLEQNFVVSPAALSPVNFVAKEDILPPVSTANIAGAETSERAEISEQFSSTAKKEGQSGNWKRFMTSPRNVVSAIYLVLSALVLLALFLAVLIKIRIQHPHIIANGLVLLGVISSLVVFNSSLALASGAI